MIFIFLVSQLVAVILKTCCPGHYRKWDNLVTAMCRETNRTGDEKGLLSVLPAGDFLDSAWSLPVTQLGVRAAGEWMNSPVKSNNCKHSGPCWHLPSCTFRTEDNSILNHLVEVILLILNLEILTMKTTWISALISFGSNTGSIPREGIYHMEGSIWEREKKKLTNCISTAGNVSSHPRDTKTVSVSFLICTQMI